MSLKNKTISGLKWSFTDSMVNQVVHFVFGIVLARLLSPSEYGIIGMSMVFVALFEKIVDGGLEQALIRKQNCTEADYNTMFYTNIVVGIFSFVILFFASGAIATFYKNTEIKLLMHEQRKTNFGTKKKGKLTEKLNRLISQLRKEVEGSS